MFLSRVKADAGSDRSVFSNFWFDAVGRLTGSGARVTADTALGLPAVFACVRVLAESFAVMPFELYAPKDDGTRGPKVRKHWLTRLFRKAPNQFQSPFEWRLMLQGHLALRGNAFCQITANSKGEVTDLLPLHPDRMKVEMLTNGSYRYVYTDQTGSQVFYTRGEIWHLRSLSSDGICGLSPIEVARESIGEGLAMQSYSSRFFANDAKPGGGWIEYPGSFADKATKQTFRESWQEMQGGGNRGKVAVLEKGMKFHELGLNNADSQFVEARGLKVSDIARMFRVPPHKIGDLSKATFSNIEQQSIEFWTDTMLPWAELWESSVEFFLLGPDSDFEPEFDMSRMLRGDSAARTAYYQGGIQSGWLNRNEPRQAEGYDPVDGLDEFLVPLNMATVAQAQAAADAKVQLNQDPVGGGSGDGSGTAGKGAKQVRRETLFQALNVAAEARIQALLAGNAARMARRIAEGKPPTAEVLADAMAVTAEQAQTWLDAWPAADRNESTITASLMALGNLE